MGVVHARRLLGQSTIFAIICCVPILIFIAVVPRRWLAFTVGASGGSGRCCAFLVFDAIVYHLYHFYHYHLAGVVWQIMKAGVFSQVLALSWIEWAGATVIGISLLAVEIIIAFLVWRRVT